MHTRRKFLMGALAPALFATAARAGVRCIPDPKHGGSMCKTSIDFTDAYQETYHARHEARNVWIACVAVVFAAYGHVIQQLRLLLQRQASDQIRNPLVHRQRRIQVWRGRSLSTN